MKKKTTKKAQGRTSLARHAKEEKTDASDQARDYANQVLRGLNQGVIGNLGPLKIECKQESKPKHEALTLRAVSTTPKSLPKFQIRFEFRSTYVKIVQPENRRWGVDRIDYDEASVWRSVPQKVLDEAQRFREHCEGWRDDDPWRFCSELDEAGARRAFERSIRNRADSDSEDPVEPPAVVFRKRSRELRDHAKLLAWKAEVVTQNVVVNHQHFALEKPAISDCIVLRVEFTRAANGKLGRRIVFVCNSHDAPVPYGQICSVNFSHFQRHGESFNRFFEKPDLCDRWARQCSDSTRWTTLRNDSSIRVSNKVAQELAHDPDQYEFDDDAGERFKQTIIEYHTAHHWNTYLRPWRQGWRKTWMSKVVFAVQRAIAADEDDAHSSFFTTQESFNAQTATLTIAPWDEEEGWPEQVDVPQAIAVMSKWVSPPRIQKRKDGFKITGTLDGVKACIVVLDHAPRSRLKDCTLNQLQSYIAKCENVST